MNRQQLIGELRNILGFPVPLDNIIMTFTHKLEIDIVELDKELDKRNEKYDSDKCLYDGKEVSMRDVLPLIYGEEKGNRAASIIDMFLEKDD